jgi:hypothetical protein
MVNDATVIDADILALNGLLRIDRVLMIPEDGQPTVRPWDQMRQIPQSSSLYPKPQT